MPTLKKFSITGTAGNLEGIANLPDEVPRAIVVVAHPLPTMGGTMDNKVVTTMAKTFVELGFVALRFNFRGVGNSAGKFDDGNGEVEDVLAVVRHARQEYGDLPLILSGFSFGGYVQARAALQLQYTSASASTSTYTNPSQGSRQPAHQGPSSGAVEALRRGDGNLPNPCGAGEGSGKYCLAAEPAQLLGGL